MKQHITVQQLKEYIDGCWASNQISDLLNIQSFDDWLHENKNKWKDDEQVNWNEWNKLSYSWFLKTAKLFTESNMKEIIAYFSGDELICALSFDELWDKTKEWLGASLACWQELLNKLDIDKVGESDSV